MKIIGFISAILISIGVISLVKHLFEKENVEDEVCKLP